jgi:hypothetical protein
VTLRKFEQSSPYGPTHRRPGAPVDLPVVAAAMAIAGVLLVWLVPPLLVLPALSLLSLTAAGIVALLAHFSGADRHVGADRHADGVTLWDMAGLFVLMWAAAGVLSEPEHVARQFGQ